MSAIFTAADISGLDTSVTALATGLVAVALIGTAYAYVRKYLPGKK